MVLFYSLPEGDEVVEEVRIIQWDILSVTEREEMVEQEEDLRVLTEDILTEGPVVRMEKVVINMMEDVQEQEIMDRMEDTSTEEEEMESVMSKPMGIPQPLLEEMVEWVHRVRQREGLLVEVVDTMEDEVEEIIRRQVVEVLRI